MNAVTMDHLESLVVKEEYIRPEIAPTLTICILLLKNGFSLRGESACADPKMFDEQLGREYARRDAIQKAWPLEGYSLREKLHNLDRVVYEQSPVKMGFTIMNQASEAPDQVADDVDPDQATVTTAVGRCPAGPNEEEWRRVRAVELAISAGGQLNTGSLVDAAKKIEAFLKGGLPDAE